MAKSAVISPPTTLAMEEYRRDWEPRGWQLLIIGPTATWRQEWKEWEAIRDIVQNALDETEGYTWGWDSEGLWLADPGRGIQVADFLLGPPKPKPFHARGRFGEGMKLAALALLRLGYSVRVDTVGRELWMVFLKVRVDGEAEQLTALWRADGRKVGTRFHIIGYQGTAFEDRFVVNIPREAILHQGPSPLHEPVRRWNQLIGEPFQGRLYARDIYMRDINSPWSYNLWGFEMAPDRHGPKDEGQMWQDVGRLWATVTRVDLLERLLGMITSPPEERTAESDHLTFEFLGEEPVTKTPYRDFISQQAWAWREAWERKFGRDAVLQTRRELDRVVEHLGYRPITFGWGVEGALAKAIKTDVVLVKESQERLREAQGIPEAQLTRMQLVHLKLARAIAARVTRVSPVAGVHAAIIPPASDRVRTAGLYSRTTQEVLISPDQLEREVTTVDTLVHELAHHTSGAEDLSPGHADWMTRVGALVLEATAAREFDELLKEVMW